MRRTAWGALVTAGLIISYASSLALSQEETTPADRPEVRRVVLTGNQIISSTTVLGKIQTQEGQPFSQFILNEDIKRLYQTGFFSDVKATVRDVPGGVEVVLTVTEKPLYDKVEWEGARAIKPDKLQKLIPLQRGEFLDERKLQQGLQAVREEYERKGYPNVLAEYTVRADPSTGEATVYILVDEAGRVRITRILVEGNAHVSDGRVRKVMKSKRWHWFRSGKYQHTVLAEDADRVAAFYRSRGFQDAVVTSVTSLDGTGRRMTITMLVDEGPLYQIETVTLAGNVLFPEREIRKGLTLAPGAAFTLEGLQADTRAIQGFYFDRGYIFAQVSPEPAINPETHRVKAAFRIEERELGYIDRIDVRGNLRTKDVVIRRELRVRPGEAFNGIKLRRSRERLMNLGYFEEVDFETAPGAEPTHQDLIVNVKEQKTGQFSFGGGFSSVDRLLGFVELEQRNFDWRNWPTLTGAGQDARARVEIGTVRRNYELSFTEPWWFGKPVSFGFDLFSRSILQNRSLGFGVDEEHRGGDLRFGHEFTDTIRGDASYRLERVKISDIPEEASADLRAEEGTNTISAVGTALSYDTRDNRFEPSRGMTFSVGGDVAGSFLGGDRDFYRLAASSGFYVPHMKHFVLEWRTRTGVVDAYGDSSEVPIFERYFGGGAGTIRGFRERRVGPLDERSNDPIGGETLLVSNVDWVFPIVQNLKGSVFFDVGNVWRRVDDYAESFEAGTGVGVRIKTPIGPVRLDLGFPLTQVRDEKKKLRFHFNVSRGF